MNLRNSTALICKTFAFRLSCKKTNSENFRKFFTVFSHYWETLLKACKQYAKPEFHKHNWTRHLVHTRLCVYLSIIHKDEWIWNDKQPTRGVARIGCKQFPLFKKLLAGIICGFQTEDRSKSLEVTDTPTSVQDKHGRAQVCACVIIIFINWCRNEVDLILSRAFIFAPLRNVSLFNSLFNLWAECCVTTQSTAVLQTNK